MSHNHDVISFFATSYRDENCRFSRFLGDQNSHQLCLHASTTKVKSFQPCISSDSVSDSLSIQIPMFNEEFSFLVMTHNFLFMHTTSTPEGFNVFVVILVAWIYIIYMDCVCYIWLTFSWKHWSLIKCDAFLSRTLCLY